jgi:hypothetical protein
LCSLFLYKEEKIERQSPEYNIIRILQIKDG